MSIILPSSVMQKSRHYNVSDRYESVDSELIVNSLINRGFDIYNIQESRVRKAENKGFQKHMIWMTYEALRTEEGVPSIVVMNSHDRSSSLKFHTGYIRWACSNQLVGGNDISSMVLRHSSNWKDKASDFLDGYLHNVERMNREHQRMQGQYLHPHKIMELAHRAAELRYDARDVLDTNELTLIRRKEDAGMDAYKVYNRIQESLLQGLFQRRIKHVTEEGEVQYSDWGKAQRITANDEIIRLNKSLREIVLEAC